MRNIPTGPLFKWFGSKWLLAKRLPKPVCDTIIEPFAGSAGYSLRYADQRVLIAEINIHLSYLWIWLIKHATESDIRSIPVNLKEGTDIRNVGLSLGQATLLKTWQRTNNVGECWTISPWGNKPGQWTANTRARVAEEISHIKHWSFYNTADELFTRDMSATWYIDPPYRFNYDYKTPKLDYEKLAFNIEKLKGQIIVSEATCQIMGSIPSYLPFSVLGKAVTSRRKSSQNHHSNELIYHITK